VLKEMEDNIRRSLPARERAQILPVAMNNLAYFYYRKGKYQASHAHMAKAMQMERKAYGAVDFATHLRMAAVTARLSHHTEALGHCRAALRVLQESAAQEQADPEGAPALPRAYHAHLAVVYHNLAVQLAYLQQLQHASGTAKVAQQLVTQALPAKHRWVRHISSSARRLRDMHLSTSFVEHSLRPSLAGRTPFAARITDEADGGDDGEGGDGGTDEAYKASSDATFLTVGGIDPTGLGGSPSGGGSLPALRGA